MPITADSFRKHITSDINRPLKPRVISSYVSYFNRGLKILKIDQEIFFRITSVSHLKEIKEKLIKSSAFKKIPESSQEHIRSVFGKYITYTSNLELVENIADDYIKNLMVSYYETSLNENKKARDLMIRRLSFVERPISTPKFSNALCKYIDINTEREFKFFCKVVSDFHDGKYYELVASKPKLVSKLLAVIAHLKFLKSKA